MPDYSKAKIYKIVPTCEYDEGDEYFGSTTRPLSERMNAHRCDFKNGKCKSKILFEKYGVENCKIELVEEYPCDNREQLNKKEGEYIRANKCVNRCIAGRTDNEYRIDNVDKIKKRNKQYYIDNANKIKERNKQYDIDNTDKIKQYRIDNSDKIKEYQKQYRIDNANNIKNQKKQYYLTHKTVLDINPH
jgi:hypothetical protein